MVCPNGPQLLTKSLISVSSESAVCYDCGVTTARAARYDWGSRLREQLPAAAQQRSRQTAHAFEIMVVEPIGGHCRR
jgi:hypothetical protein